MAIVHVENNVQYLYRSRLTLMNILEKRNYDIEKYSNFSDKEIELLSYNISNLNFTVERKAEDKSKIRTCKVRYFIELKSQKLNMFDSGDDGVADDDTNTVEFIIMMVGNDTDIHHISSIKEYAKLKTVLNEKGEKERRKLRVNYFNISKLVVNPMNHKDVPVHIIVPEDEHKDLLESLNCTSKLKLPEIKYRDIQVRCIGGAPGDIIRIIRPTPCTGESIFYRLCTV
jgi:DNA-directed RNA polymerase subunit H (RpoH/RPB5)